MNDEIFVAPGGAPGQPDKWTKLGYVDPESIKPTDGGGYTVEVGQPIDMTPQSVTFTLEHVDYDALCNLIFGLDHEVVSKLVDAGYRYTEGTTASGYHYRRFIKKSDARA